MPISSFFSFHFDQDCWRAAQVREMGTVDGNVPVSDNDWASMKRAGPDAVKRWIAGQMRGRKCVVVLVGQHTASRPWVLHEIESGWRAGLGVVGIRIHDLLDSAQQASLPGANPFASTSLGANFLSNIVTLWTPTGHDSRAVYADIKRNLAGLVDAAIKVRGRFS